MCVDFIADNYHHLFSMPKRGFVRFLNSFLLTQLKDYITQKHKKDHLKSCHLWDFNGKAIHQAS